MPGLFDDLIPAPNVPKETGMFDDLISASAPDKPKLSASDAFGRSMATSATFNFYDELSGLLRAGGLKPDDPDVANAIK